MGMPKYSGRRDENEPIIVEYLEKRGFSIYRLPVPLDLLVGYKRKNYLIEVKTKNGKLTQLQKDFISIWRGQHIIIDSIQQAKKFADSVVKPASF